MFRRNACRAAHRCRISSRLGLLTQARRLLRVRVRQRCMRALCSSGSFRQSARMRSPQRGKLGSGRLPRRLPRMRRPTWRSPLVLTVTLRIPC